MSSVPSENAAPAGFDAQLTGERQEVKYLIPAGQIHDLVTAFDQQISSHRFHGEGSNPLPYAQHFITSAYLDTPSRAHYRAALENDEHHVKVRAREYYDLHPSLTELATSPEQILHHQPWIWLEIKRRDGSRTLKQRAKLPKREMPRLFPGQASGEDPFAALAANHEHHGVLEEITDYCRSIGEPLSPVCLANFQRLSWQQQLLRVTLDLGVAFFRPAPGLWQHEQVLARSILGKECGRTTPGVLELKYRNEVPEWLTSWLDRKNLRPGRHSKFVLASKAVYGD